MRGGNLGSRADTRTDPPIRLPKPAGPAERALCFERK